MILGVLTTITVLVSDFNYNYEGQTHIKTTFEEQAETSEIEPLCNNMSQASGITLSAINDLNDMEFSEIIFGETSLPGCNGLTSWSILTLSFLLAILLLAGTPE